jgi:hypothetical protein
MKSLFALLLPGALLLVGCQATRPLYYWGNYEDVIYLSFARPDKADLEMQMEKLQNDVRRTAANHARAHPGLHAQLGYVYYQLGRLGDAVHEFESEKDLFPEAAPFMDRMIARTKEGIPK